jgi:hypothetical protein
MQINDAGAPPCCNRGRTIGDPVMNPNVGTVDRTVRILAGLVLIGLALAGVIGAWGWIGVVPVLTGALGWCPAYLPFGISTCSAPKR